MKVSFNTWGLIHAMFFRLKFGDGLIYQLCACFEQRWLPYVVALDPSNSIEGSRTVTVTAEHHHTHR